MSKQTQDAAEFLGVRVLTPLEETRVAGGLAPVVEQHDHDTDTATQHDHVHT